MEGPCCSQNEEQDALQAGDSILFPKTALEKQQGHVLQPGELGLACRKPKPHVASREGCPSQLVHAEPLCRDTRDSHVHPLVVLPAEGSASTTQHPHCSLYPSPSHLSRAAPRCRSLCGAQFPEQGSTWRLRGSRGSPASWLRPQELNRSFSRSSEASSHAAVPYSRAGSVHGPTGPQTHPEKSQMGCADPSNHTDPSASQLWRADLTGEGCA